MLDDAGRDPFLTPVTDFRGTRAHAGPGDRRRAIVKAAHGLRERLESAPPVRWYRSCDIVRAPYPTRYALRDACAVPTAFVHILNRLFVVQFDTRDGPKTLLVSPTDPIANAQTPFFRRLAESLPLRDRLRPWVAPITRTVPEWLQTLGIAPEAIDYITYDHLHTQDLRPWLGTSGRPGLFPRAKLLVHAQEWSSAQDLAPPQRDWYCPDGLEGVDPARVVRFTGDVMLGDSIVLMHTPGHTEGNHSIVVRTSEGILVTSENGVCADSYAPERSRIPGVAAWARRTGMDVVLNGNTLEGGLDQYLSMVQEREVAGPSRRNPEFFGVVPSSELAASWLSPGVGPTFSFGELELGRRGGQVEAG